MYLHLGQDVIIKTADIVGIFDIEKTTVSKATRNFLTKKETEKKVITVSEELPKSFIVCNHKGKITVYISQISPATLLKRTEILNKISFI